MNLDLTLTIPADISFAALKIEKWAAENGYREWELHGIASRNLVSKLRAELEGFTLRSEGNSVHGALKS